MVLGFLTNLIFGSCHVGSDDALLLLSAHFSLDTILIGQSRRQVHGGRLLIIYGNQVGTFVTRFTLYTCAPGSC